MKKFIVGNEYSTRSICDRNVIFKYKIINRTEKMVTLDNGKKYKIFIYENNECIKPEGNYSMCPTLRA